MVTLILIFVFFSPRLINFNDRPVEHNPHSSGVLVYPDGKGEFIYQVEAGAVSGSDDTAGRAAVPRVISAIFSTVSTCRDRDLCVKPGRAVALQTWVQPG